MQHASFTNIRIARYLAVILLAALLSSCSTATAVPAQPTAVQENLPTATIAPATATATLPPPTETPTLAPSPVPTQTPVPPTTTPTAIPALGLLPDGISGSCLPEGSLVPAVSGDIQDTGKKIAFKDGSLEIDNLPASSCTILFTFNQVLTAEVLQGLKLQVFDASATPWLEAALKPIEGHPEMAGVVLTHTYIVAPPWWDISYKFSLLSGATALVDHAPANLHRWKPALCWDQHYPNLKTMSCTLQQDQHPWDTWYGKPMPTGVPEN